MNLELLIDFLAIAREGKLTVAATQRRANHSTLYRRLNQLESQLKCRLFERLHDGYQLTQAGQELFTYAERIEQEAMAAERSLTGKDMTLQGEIRVTAPEHIAYEYLPGYLAVFHKQYPRIRITIIVSNSDLNLNRREADIAIRATPEPPQYLVGRKVLELPWYVFGSSGYVKRVGAPDSIRTLIEHDWVGPDAALFHLAAYTWFHKHIREERVKVRATSLNAIAKLAETGMGLAVLPVDQSCGNLKILMPFEPGRGSDLWLLTHPDLRNTGRMKVLMDFLMDAFRQDERLTPVGHESSA
jgi:DNA-binding transcriptional LysR family regulator